MTGSVRRLILKIVADLPQKEREEREQRAAGVRDRIASRRVDDLDEFEEQLCVVGHGSQDDDHVHCRPQRPHV